MESREFNIEVDGFSLEFEFFTYESIVKSLKEKFGEDHIKAYSMSAPNKWREIRKDNKWASKFFTYIKLFEVDGTLYGLLVGKTTYYNPGIIINDVAKTQHKFWRIFIDNMGYSVSDTILVIHHGENSSTHTMDYDLVKRKDDLQARFIEQYVQTKYNLFDN